jgi:hypothetical protein
MKMPIYGHHRISAMTAIVAAMDLDVLSLGECLEWHVEPLIVRARAGIARMSSAVDAVVIMTFLVAGGLHLRYSAGHVCPL